MFNVKQRQIPANQSFGLMQKPKDWTNEKNSTDEGAK